MTYALRILASVFAVIAILVPHEFAHAYVAYKNGDCTAKAYGRMTLNPFRHIDPAGFICCVFVGFGWARPVPVNYGNFRKYRVGIFTTAMAGVAINYITAFISYLLYALLTRFVIPAAGGIIFAEYLFYFLQTLTYLIFAYGLYCFCFNLLPLFPLDGFRIVESFTRQINPVQKFLRNYGQVILISLIAESFICNICSRYAPIFNYFNLLGYVSWFAEHIIGFPITSAWGWILRL